MCGNAGDFTPEGPFDQWIGDPGAEPPPEMRRALVEIAGHAEASHGRRMRLWEIRPELVCSVVGTCLSEDDLQRVLRKARLSFPAGTPAYDVHGYVVEHCQRRSQLSKAIQKLLDNRHKTVIDGFQKLPDDGAVLDRWHQCRDTGRLAGGYWAVMTRAGLSKDLQTRVFGEVHMLAHDLSRRHRQHVDDLAERDLANMQAEAKLERTRRAAHRKLAEKDEHAARQAGLIASLRSQLAALRNDRAARPADHGRQRLERLASGQSRKIASLREQKRDLEARNAALSGKLSELESRMRALAAGAARSDAPAAGTPAVSTPPLKGRCVLYVGGREGVVSRIRSYLDGIEVDMIHHDGGMQDSPHRLDALIERADVVFCPVDCVSHDACLRAKRQCNRLCKRFVPLRNSSQACFLRSLSAADEPDSGAVRHA